MSIQIQSFRKTNEHNYASVLYEMMIAADQQLQFCSQNEINVSSHLNCHGIHMAY